MGVSISARLSLSLFSARVSIFLKIPFFFRLSFYLSHFFSSSLRRPLDKPTSAECQSPKCRYYSYTTKHLQFIENCIAAQHTKVFKEYEKEYFLRRQKRIITWCFNSVIHKQQVHQFTGALPHVHQHTLLTTMWSVCQPPHHCADMECRVNFLIKSRRSYYFWDRLDCPRSVAAMALGF